MFDLQARYLGADNNHIAHTWTLLQYNMTQTEGHVWTTMATPYPKAVQII